MTARESKARRLLRQMALSAEGVLKLTPKDPQYAQTRLTLEALIAEVKLVLGPDKPTRAKHKRTSIDLPDPHDPGGPWKCIATLPYAEALAFVRNNLGADEKGRIYLLTEIEDE